MAELAGCWRPGARPEESQHQLEAVLASTGVELRAQAAGRHGFVSGYSLPRLPQRVSLARSNDLTVVVAGRVFDLPSSQSAAQHIAATYTAGRFDFLARLSGDFVAAIMDDRAAQLMLVRDRVGTRPLYYAKLGGQLIFATQVKPLLGHASFESRPQLNALAELFLGARWLKPGETIFGNVLSIPPAHVLVATPGAVRLHRYWEFDLGERIRNQDPREQFRYLFDRAVSRRLEEKSAVFVSGGLDSSAIYCSAINSGARPLGISWTATDGSAADEQTYIEALEKHTGQSIDRVTFEPVEDPWSPHEWVWRSEFPVVRTAAGPWERAQQIVSERGITTVLDGGWGDQVLAPWPPPYLFTLMTHVRLPTLAKHLRSILTMVPPVQRLPVRRDVARMFLRELTPQPLLDLRRPLVNRSISAGPFTDEFKNSLSAHERWTEWLPRGLDPHASAIYQTIRLPFCVTRYETANKSAVPYGYEHCTPFLDLELIEFLMRIPGELQFRDGVFKALLRDSMQTIMPASILARRDKANFEPAVTGAIDARWDELEETIRGCRAGIQHGVFDAQRLGSRLDFLRSARHIQQIAATGELYDLFGLCVWLTVFYGDTTRGVHGVEGNRRVEAPA